MNHKPFYKAEAVFSTLPDYPSCHASTLVCLPGGDLLTAFYAGTVEKAPDVAIFGSRYVAAKEEWSSPTLLVDVPEKSVGNPLLFLDPTGILWLFYLVMEGHKWHHCTIHYMRSEDVGHTWGPSKAFRSQSGWTTRNNLIVLEDGAYLFPLSDNVEGSSVFMRSLDAGRSWEELGCIRSEPHNEQPAVVQLSDGSLLTYARTSGKGGDCWQSRSFDQGATWTEAKPGPFPNPNAAMAMIRLVSGHLVIVYNDSDRFRYRTPLNVALSTDEGATWPFVRTLEDQPGEFTYRTDRLDNRDSIEFSYPALAQDEEGYIHITYTNCRENIKHVIVNEAWLMQKQEI